MSAEREYLDRIFDSMKVGEWFNIEGNILRRVYPCGFPSIYETYEQSFLSSRIGSMWGTYTIELLFDRDVYVIKRHESDCSRITYVDPDREHLFNKKPDGSYERIET